MEYRLSDLTIDGRGTYGIAASAVDYDPQKPTYLRITDINDDGTINFEGLKSVDDENSFKYVLKENDIVFARTGASTGRSYFYQKEDGVFVYAGFLIKFSLDPQKVNPRYLKYYTHSKIYYDWVHSFDSGATRGNINAKTFGEMLINLPERKIQDKIVSVMKDLDDKIAVNRRICANLEAQAQALFKHWFIDFAPFKDGKFVESELGMIPEGWRVGKVQDLASKMASGGTPTSTNRDYYGGDVLWFSTKELTDSFLLDSEKHITQTGLENSSAKLFPEDTVLMAIYAAPTVGRLGILTQEASFNQAAVGIVAKEEIGYEYIYLLLLSERKNLNNLACGAAQQNLNVGIVKNYKCVIPTKQVLSIFRKMITEIFLQCKELQKESSRLGELRDTLLPKLMSGEIKV